MRCALFQLTLPLPTAVHDAIDHSILAASAVPLQRCQSHTSSAACLLPHRFFRFHAEVVSERTSVPTSRANCAAGSFWTWSRWSLIFASSTSAIIRRESPVRRPEPLLFTRHFVVNPLNIRAPSHAEYGSVICLTCAIPVVLW